MLARKVPGRGVSLGGVRMPSMVEYRRTRRVRTSIPVQLDLTRRYAFAGIIVSLTTRGCLIETGVAEQLAGKDIFLRLQLPERQFMTLRGRVIYLLVNSKCGVEFTELTSTDKGLLVELVRHWRRLDEDGLSQA
jgi:hypothetical protein